MSEYRNDTKCIHAGYHPGNGEPRVLPIVQSTTFRYETSEAMGRLFDLEDPGFFYTRLGNPTLDAVEKKLSFSLAFAGDVAHGSATFSAGAPTFTAD